MIVITSVNVVLFYQETHIMQEFSGDLYGRLLKLSIVGFIRPEQNFNSLGTLALAVVDSYIKTNK